MFETSHAESLRTSSIVSLLIDLKVLQNKHR